MGIGEMRQIEVRIIGTGWYGGIRVETCARDPAVRRLQVAETSPERLGKVAKTAGAIAASADDPELLAARRPAAPEGRRMRPAPPEPDPPLANSDATARLAVLPSAPGTARR